MSVRRALRPRPPSDDSGDSGISDDQDDRRRSGDAEDARDSPPCAVALRPEIPTPPVGDGVWRRGILNHWNRMSHCGSVWSRSQTYYTFRSAFLTPDREFPKPDVDTKVFWQAGPDRRNPGKLAATKVVMLTDFQNIPSAIKDSIMNGFTSAQLNDFEKFDTSRPGRNWVNDAE
eukprot:gene293-595_t